MSEMYTNEVKANGRAWSVCHLRLIEGKTPGTFVLRMRSGELEDAFEMHSWLIKAGRIDPGVLEDVIYCAVSQIRGDILMRFSPEADGLFER